MVSEVVSKGLNHFRKKLIYHQGMVSYCQREITRLETLAAQHKMHPTGGTLRQSRASKRKAKAAKSVGSPTSG